MSEKNVECVRGLYATAEAMHMKQSWQRWLEGFDEYAAREEGRGTASGAPVSASIYQVITMGEGKVFRFQESYDEQSALKAAGLSE